MRNDRQGRKVFVRLPAGTKVSIYGGPELTGTVCANKYYSLLTVGILVSAVRVQPLDCKAVNATSISKIPAFEDRTPARVCIGCAMSPPLASHHCSSSASVWTWRHLALGHTFFAHKLGGNSPAAAVVAHQLRLTRLFCASSAVCTCAPHCCFVFFSSVRAFQSKRHFNHCGVRERSEDRGKGKN